MDSDTVGHRSEEQMTGHEHHHELARGTHTPELRQIHELNAGLATADQAGTAIMAESLGMTGRPVTGPAGAMAPRALPASAVLDHLTAEGPPDFPYIMGRFRARGEAGAGAVLLQADMHTTALRRLSAALHLHHVWGT
jgi:hypothetical protein